MIPGIQALMAYFTILKAKPDEDNVHLSFRDLDEMREQLQYALERLAETLVAFEKIADQMQLIDRNGLPAPDEIEVLRELAVAHVEKVDCVYFMLESIEASIDARWRHESQRRLAGQDGKQ